MAEQLIEIEVAYAKPDKQTLIPLRVHQGITAGQAVRESGVLEQCPELDLNAMNLGVFGKACQVDHILQAGDRVEIYRPLVMDPKEQRRYRAGKGQ